MCRVQQFCCGCSLRQGAITAAVLSGVTMAMLLIGGAVTLYMDKETSPGGSLHVQLGDQFNRESIRNDIRLHQKELDDTKSWIFTIAAIVFFVFAALYLIALIFLIFGIMQNRAGFVLPWLVLIMINIVLGCLWTFILVIFGNTISLLSIAVYAGWIYMWIVVLNFYRKLQETGPAYSPPAYTAPA